MAGKVQDWTGTTLTLDLVNSLGEVFHFEIEPGEKDDLPAPRENDEITIKILIPVPQA